MKKISLFIFLLAFITVPYVYAQESVRLGASSVSYNSRALDHVRTSVAFGTEGSWYYAGTRLDFDRNSAYWNIAHLELGPRFLRAGPGLVFGNPNKRSDELRINFSATFKPWKGLYFNSRWAPISLSNRPNSKNFLDAGAGWQFNL